MKNTYSGQGDLELILDSRQQPVEFIYSYNDINFTYSYMRTTYLRHLANTCSRHSVE